MELGSQTVPASADGADPIREAVCTNVRDCSTAAAGAVVEWYRGAGEYCPECGDALVVRDVKPSPPRPSVLPAPALPEAPAASAQRHAPPAAPVARLTPQRYWMLAAALIATAALGYAVWSFAFNRATTDLVRVCPVAGALQLAADLVRGFVAKTATPAGRFDLKGAGVCEARLSLAPRRPETVIARDALVAIVNPLNPMSRISERQLRAIFSGSIRDWSQLGEPRGPVIPVLPDADSVEAKALAASLFSGLRIDRGTLRGSTSADVVRIVAKADSTGRSAIGLVALGRLGTAKLIRLTDAPPPDPAAIAAGRYPYTLTIGIEPGAGPSALANAFIKYARSADGAAIVRADGFIPPDGR
jgi:hypothetical protein